MVRFDLCMSFIDGTRQYIKSFNTMEETEEYIHEKYPKFFCNEYRTYRAELPNDTRKLHVYLEENDYE